MKSRKKSWRSDSFATPIFARSPPQPSRSQLQQEFRQESAEEILPEVRHHSRPQAFSPPRKQAEHQSERGDHHHVLQALISVRCAEQDRLHSNSDRHVARKIAERALQIPAVDDLFAESRAQHEQYV